MTEKDLRRLNRAELLEMLIAQGKEMEELRAQMSEMQKKLDDRQICLNQAGSIAEASLQLNGVFEAAQAAADQYLAQVHAANEQSQQLADRIVADAQRKATAIVQQAQQEADRICAMTDEGTQQKWAELQEKTDTMLQSYEALRLALQK